VTKGSNKLLNEYAAAALVGMSPELLRWFTSYAPKQGITRKLKVAKEDDDVVYYDSDELLSFNDWLRTPWPSKDGERPPIPAGIRREIKYEANGECAICHSHKDTCEAAHLDPVAKSKNNHPENLLWLCSNHHTSYDDGLFGPKEENAEFVTSFKIALHHYKKMKWRMQDKLSHKLFIILDNCDLLHAQLKKAKTKEEIKAVEKLAKDTINLLPQLAPVSKADSTYHAYQSISVALDEVTSKTQTVSVQLNKARKVRKAYVAALGYVACPLCKASGVHDGYDCPVCSGDREIEEDAAESVDLRDFQSIDCPVCKGKGKFKGNDCPACGGDATMERRFAERIDPRDYSDVTCPLCKGKGRRNGLDCPECGGEGSFEARFLDGVDLRRYDEVDCPLCKGEGIRDGETCPACDGNRTMERRHAEEVDLGSHKIVKCPLCKGRQTYEGDNCPACGGDGEMDRRHADQIDLGDYKEVKCPACKGRRQIDGEECRACDGNGTMQRRFAERDD
jgi:DnaJ-class molecular chaperone